MTPNIKNQQEHVAEEFRQAENFIAQESRVALLKIQSWQFIVKTPEVGLQYQKEAEEMLKKSLFSFVSNSYVMESVGYYSFLPEN